MASKQNFVMSCGFIVLVAHPLRNKVFSLDGRVFKEVPQLSLETRSIFLIHVLKRQLI